MMNLSPNFSLIEFLRSDIARARSINNHLSSDLDVTRLRVTAFYLEQVRFRLNHLLNKNVAIFITSGFRNSELNRAVGGVSNSAHLTGKGVDFVPKSRGEETARLIDIAVGILQDMRDCGLKIKFKRYPGHIHFEW